MRADYPLPKPHAQLHASLQEGVLSVTLGWQAQAAQLDPIAILGLDALLAHAADDAQVRVVLLQGSGASFSTGLDAQACAQLAASDASVLDQALYTLRRWRQGLLRQLAVPIVALVSGDCQGAAVSLIEACDIVLCSEQASFELAGPDAAWLARELGAQPCGEWLETQRASSGAPVNTRLDAAQAQAMGLVTFAIAQPMLANELTKLLGQLCQKDALALRLTKDTLAHAGSMSWDAAVSFTAAKFAQIKALQGAHGSSRATAIAGFVAGKRKPALDT